METGVKAVEIEVLLKQGIGIRKVARMAGVSRNTVRKVKSEGSARRYQREARPGKLAAFARYIADRITAASPDWIPASVILREIKAKGYSGSHSILRAHMAALRPRVEPEPVIRFETAPGQQMQVDWAEFRVDGKRWYGFVAVLGYSRWIFARFVDSQRFEALRDLHVQTFDAMGGVPRTVLYDNMATVVLQRDVDGVGKHRYHPAMQSLAKDYGFVVRLCQPYRAQTKGKVERSIGYLRRSFWIPLVAELRQSHETLSLDLVNARLSAWLRAVANVRVHGTTGVKPEERMEEERTKLQPLPHVTLGHTAREASASPKPTVRSSEPLQRSLASYEVYSAGSHP